MRAEPLGQDRRFNRYWRVLAGGEDGGDPAAGRLLVELAPGGGCADQTLENPSSSIAAGRAASGGAAQAAQAGLQPGAGAAPERAGGWVEVAGAQALDGLMAALDKRGPREGALHTALLRHRDALLRRMPASPLRCAPLPDRNRHCGLPR